MFPNKVFEPVKDFSLQYLYLLLQIFLVVCIPIISVILLIQFSSTARYLRRLTTLKLHSFDILGHLLISVNNRIGLNKTLHTYHVYDFQALCAYTKLCPKESLTPIWLLSKPFLLLHKADSVKMILNSSVQLKKSWFYFVLHEWLGFGLLTSEGQKWKQRRKLLTPTFHFDILKNFLPGINGQSKVLVDVLSKCVDEDWIDFSSYMARCSLDIICETTMGVKVNCQIERNSKYVEAVSDISETSFDRMMTPWLWSDLFFTLAPIGRRNRRSLKTIHAFTRKVIADRKEEMLKNRRSGNVETNVDGVYRGHKKKAFLDFLLEEHLDNKTLTEEDIREEVDTFTFEGHDTTAMGLTWASYLIGLHPEVQRKIQEELSMIFGDDKERDVTVEDLKDLKYLERVLKEAQRLYPSVPLFGRMTTENIEFEGKTIPKGVNVTILTYMLHRDPNVFPNPEVFDPDRFLPENCEGRHPFAYIPFSAGPRNCIGQRFAMMEEKVVLATLLRNYTVHSLDPRDEVLVVADVILRSCYPIRIRIQRRED